MANPFNTIENLLSFTSFRQGAGGANDIGETLKQSVLDGTFALSQFQTALQQARDEIYYRAGELDNDEYETGRRAQLVKAELYFARSLLIDLFSEKIATKFPESQFSGVGSVTLGSDVPDPLSKMSTWRRIAKMDWQRGTELLRGHKWGYRSFAVGYDETYYPFETNFNEG